MAKTIFWVHDQAMNSKQCELEISDNETQAVFIWDNSYFYDRSYSLKRLIFIYETLCQLPVEIIEGDTLSVIQAWMPLKIKTFYTVDSKLNLIIQQLSKSYQVEIIKPVFLAQIDSDRQFKRFFNYWNSAQKTAFLKNGGSNMVLDECSE